MSLVDFRSHRPLPPHLDCPCGCGGHGQCNRPQPCPPRPRPPDIDGLLSCWAEVGKFKAFMTEIVEEIMAKQGPKGLVNYSYNEQALGITAPGGQPLFQKSFQPVMPSEGTPQLTIATPHGLQIADVTAHDNRLYDASTGNFGSMPYMDNAGGLCDYYISPTDIVIFCNETFIDQGPTFTCFMTLIYVKAT
jgi:hypothetical protein